MIEDACVFLTHPRARATNYKWGPHLQVGIDKMDLKNSQGFQCVIDTGQTHMITEPNVTMISGTRLKMRTSLPIKLIEVKYLEGCRTFLYIAFIYNYM